MGIVQRCERALLALHDFEDMVSYLRQEVPRWGKAELHEMLTDALRSVRGWGGWGAGAKGTRAG